MKPLLLHGHERSITKIRYNREGDLLFSTAKDNKPTVWYSLNGERLGTYNGHNGAVWTNDISWDTRHFVTGAADNSVIIWDTEIGKKLSEIPTQSAVRTCNFAYSSKQFMISTDAAMGKMCQIQIFDLQQCLNERPEPIIVMPVQGPKVTASVWGPCDDYIITGHENGLLCKWDVKTGEQIDRIHEHTKLINDIQKSKDDLMFITASKDTTAKLFVSDSFKHLKTFKTERPVNSASLSPIRDHVVMGGGQEAMDVTTTSARVGKFDARFFHMIFEEEIGRVKGHFGPINSVLFHPDGKSYSSGGEDGYVRVHTFDPSYYDFKFDF
ncbi:eukaryotic translation initiation factor 3 subunit I-like [Rhopilema esculentum]|uniref:eukaryotic translation initiation factor 3 subunit I-like n=1 Tax=Rhopilema esculentum TaxID=499914 RepID=UPI0031E09FE0|eukprot:gene7591-13396_t